MHHILVINGPNLNLLGVREQSHYGSLSLDDIIKNLSSIADANKCTLSHFQSNSEEKILDKIHWAYANKVDYIIINPASLTHTSIGLRDALLGVNIPFVEIHISNIAKREEFRQKSYLSDIACGTITGFGTDCYEMAINSIIKTLKN